jgi:hypothetical protein
MGKGCSDEENERSRGEKQRPEARSIGEAAAQPGAAGLAQEEAACESGDG